jgi:Ca-activated chloride channel family protein
VSGLLHPELLHLVPLLPAVVGAAMLLWARRRRQAAEALGEAGLVRRLAPTDLLAAPNLRIALVSVAALLLGAAAVGPLWGVERAPRSASAADVVLVLDASNSMRVEDVRPDRLEWERTAARAMLDRLQGSRVGLVVFAGRGYLVSPLTDDFGALELYLDGLSPEVLTQGGSSLSDAIANALSLLVRAGDANAAGSIVLVTDGDALEERGQVIRAASVAARAGVPVHAVGIGTPRGGPVPHFDPVSGRREGYKRDPETGETAVSRLGHDLLREVARRTGGVYRPLRSPADVEWVVDAVRTVPAGRGASRAGTAPGNRYEWFLGAALLLLALDSLLAERAGRRRGLDGGGGR